MATFYGYQPVQEIYPDEKEHRRKLAQAVNQALSGKLNAVNEVTLTAGAASTTFTDDRLSVNSFIGLMPRTANAAAELGNGTLYIADAGRLSGSAVITHANNAQTDRTYTVLIIG